MYTDLKHSSSFLMVSRNTKSDENAQSPPDKGDLGGFFRRKT